MSYDESTPAAAAAVHRCRAALDELGTADALLALRGLACLVATRRARGVVEARAAGQSWQGIADLLGMSRQSVWQRFGADATEAPRPARGRPVRARRPPRAASSCASYKSVTVRTV